MRSVPGSASALIVANTYGKGEMNTRMMFAWVVAGRVLDRIYRIDRITKGKGA